MQLIQSDHDDLDCTGCMKSVSFGTSTDQLRPLPECVFNLIKQYHSIIFLSRYILKLNFKPVYYIYYLYYLYKYTALFIIYILILQERIYSFSNSSVLLYVAKMLQFVAEVLHCNKTNTILSFLSCP